MTKTRRYFSHMNSLKMGVILTLFIHNNGTTPRQIGVGLNV
jgi:hypothetical protein